MKYYAARNVYFENGYDPGMAALVFNHCILDAEADKSLESPRPTKAAY